MRSVSKQLSHPTRVSRVFPRPLKLQFPANTATRFWVHQRLAATRRPGMRREIFIRWRVSGSVSLHSVGWSRLGWTFARGHHMRRPAGVNIDFLPDKTLADRRCPPALRSRVSFLRLPPPDSALPQIALATADSRTSSLGRGRCKRAATLSHHPSMDQTSDVAPWPASGRKLASHAQRHRHIRSHRWYLNA